MGASKLEAQDLMDVFKQYIEDGDDDLHHVEMKKPKEENLLPDELDDLDLDIEEQKPITVDLEKHDEPSNETEPISIEDIDYVKDENEEDDEDFDLNLPPKAKKFLILGIIGVVGLGIIILSIKSIFSGKKTSGQVKDNVQSANYNPYSVLDLDVVEFDSTEYKDYIIVDKYIEAGDKDVHFKISGETTKNKFKICTEVNPSVYNKYRQGQVVGITFHIVDINNVKYPTEINWGEVIGE